MLKLLRAPSSRRLAGYLLLLCLLGTILSAVSCTRPAPERRQVLVKFTDGDVVDWQRTPQPFKRDVVFHWSFETDEKIGLWQPQNIDLRYMVHNEGLYIRSSSHDPYIIREGFEFDAADIDQIRIHRSANPGDEFQLFWAAPGEPFSEPRSLRRQLDDPQGVQVPVYVLDVGASEQWRGKIGRLRIDPSEIAKRRSRLMSIEGTKRSLDGERLAEVVDRPSMQDFSGDSRLSLLAPPGYRHERRLDALPTGSRLRFAYGTQADRGPAVRFAIEAESNGETVELWSATVDPVSAGRRWHDVELSLDRLVGPDVALRLVTEGPEPHDLPHGFPLWASPTVTAPTDESLPPNLVFIVADTLRADRTSLYGYERETTPHLDRWAAQNAVVFEKTVAAAPWTLPSHVSMFTGLNPLRHAANFQEPAPDSLKLLAEQLRDAGYTTVAFTGGAFLSPAFGLVQGFERFQHWGRIDDPEHTSRAGLDLDDHLPKALDWLQKDATGPFFMLFHTYEVHSPYTPRQPYFDRFNGGPSESIPAIHPVPGAPDPERAFRLDSVLREDRGDEMVPLDEDRMKIFQTIYDSGIAYTDAAVGRLLDRLSELDLERDTVVVFTSDHGEGLGDHGKAGHAYLYDFNLMVPLAISVPGRQGAGRRIATQVRHIDILPTLLEALGLSASFPMDGTSLLRFWDDDSDSDFPQVAESYAGSSNYGLSLRVADRWKYIVQNSPWQPIYRQAELFDLQADPEESDNLADTESDRTANFFNEARRRYGSQECRLHVEARNRGEYPLEVIFHGHLAQPFTVKTLDLGCEDCARWHTNWSRLELEPGESAEVFLEGSLHSEVRARARFLDGSPHSEENPGGMTQLIPAWEVVKGKPLSVRALLGERWKKRRKSVPWRDDESGFTLSWRGDACPWLTEGESSAPKTIDDETRKQLEALGYVGH